jgi:hypothetical protein
VRACVRACVISRFLQGDMEELLVAEGRLLEHLSLNFVFNG